MRGGPSNLRRSDLAEGRPRKRSLGSPMGSYLGTFTNRIDDKGRVSVPAPFRTSLAQENMQSVIVFPSLHGPYLECADRAYWQVLQGRIGAMDPLSKERQAFGRVIAANAQEIPFDANGRIVLPENLRQYAEVVGEACFAGVGDKFEIWQSERFSRAQAKARVALRDQLGIGNDLWEDI